MPLPFLEASRRMNETEKEAPGQLLKSLPPLIKLPGLGTVSEVAVTTGGRQEVSPEGSYRPRVCISEDRGDGATCRSLGQTDGIFFCLDEQS